MFFNTSFFLSFFFRDGSFPVEQERTFDLPFAKWSINPLGYSRAVLTLSGKRRWSTSEKEVEIIVEEDGLCYLQKPYDTEIAGLLRTPMSPCTLIKVSL